MAHIGCLEFARHHGSAVSSRQRPLGHGEVGVYGVTGCASWTSWILRERGALMNSDKSAGEDCGGMGVVGYEDEVGIGRAWDTDQEVWTDSRRNGAGKPTVCCSQTSLCQPECQ